LPSGYSMPSNSMVPDFMACLGCGLNVAPIILADVLRLRALEAET
jgi:hypothetical protein